MAALRFSNCRSNIAVLTLITAAFSCTAQNSPSAATYKLDMTVVKPETVGISTERLERLHAMMKQQIDEKELAGAVTILARHGKVVDFWNYGQRDIATGAPMAKDTI